MGEYHFKNLGRPDEVIEFPRMTVRVVDLGDITVGHLVSEPGWRWSEDVKPIAGTDSCQVHHTGYCLSGQMAIRFNDGTEITVGPGDVMVAMPGHDAWTVGDEPCVLLDTGVAGYAKPA